MVTKVRAGSRLLRLSSLRRLSRCLQLLFLAVLATACDLTDPARRLVVNGTVVSASDGGGYTAGQPIEGADVQLRYRSPLELTPIRVDGDVTTSSGSFRVETGPPPGNFEPLCSTLTLAVIKVGFTAATSVQLSQWCDGAGEVDGVVIELQPF